ncbi:MAG: hypothetical protein HWE16_08525 [Gammaproteobacteria bacterium]|nr:hypothetical protein [Gammaproteobacteria bacterium]
MNSDMTIRVTNAAAQMQDEQSHCAQMMAEKNQDKSDQQMDMDCCDECECSMAICSGIYSLVTTHLNFSHNISKAPTSFIQPFYIDPIQSFFKPPKVG